MKKKILAAAVVIFFGSAATAQADFLPWQTVGEANHGESDIEFRTALRLSMHAPLIPFVSMQALHHFDIQRRIHLTPSLIQRAIGNKM